MGETEEFNTLLFEKKLMNLKDTQESIQSLSSWCLKQREHHKKIVSSWLNVLKRVKIEQRLVLFYLANDVIQYSKRKSYDFVESWGLNLQKATPLVRDEKVRTKILRIFKIWEQRSVYDDEFLSDLTGLLSAGATKKTDDDPLDFQPQQLVNKIKQCSVLEADTDLRLKYIHDSHLQLSDADALCASLKDRSNKDDVEKELNEGIGCVERYTQALQREIVAREALLALLQTATQYYGTQRGEVKVVAYAYKNFGARVRALKRKLDELIPTLGARAPSPPRRDEDVPSPGPDEDLDLPTAIGEDDISYNIDRTFNTSVSADGSLYNLGLSSFLTSDNPMAIFNEPAEHGSSANKIEVINSRPNEKQDFNINDFLKTLVPNENSTASDNNSSTSKSQELPGLEPVPDLPAPISFYGAVDTLSDDPEPYNPENTPWNNNTSWSLPPAPVPPVLPVPALALAGLPATAVATATAPVPLPLPMLVLGFRSPPQSPPPAPPANAARDPPIVPHHPQYAQDMPSVDVDHRGILPPPPPPPVLPILGNVEDVDHRLLPALPTPPARTHQGFNATPDVDHRNLISLTQRPQDPRGHHHKIDQDYRVPPMVTPSDIVESVDMDLSEDEEQHGMFPPQNQNDHNRRNSFNNNKVLVGGDNGKTNHKDHFQINTRDSFEKNDQLSPMLHPPLSMPPLSSLPPLSNPFDNMPPALKNFNMPFQNFPNDDENSNDSAYEEDVRARGLDHPPPTIERHSPPEYDYDSEWQNRPEQRPFNNQRFPRNWGPRTNFRPAFGSPPFRPRNAPRPPNRWMGPRPQRFW